METEADFHGLILEIQERGMHMGNTVVEMASELTLRSIVLRLAFATLIGALVGVERSSRGRGAGVKTHALVCMGSALVMLTSEYMRVSLHNTGDMARMGAQIISGIGFLGAGTIIVTGRNHVRGLTTAAGLWVCACEGMTIGIGFWKGAVVALAFIMLTLRVLVKLDQNLHSHAKSFELYVEFDEGADIRKFMQDVSMRNATLRTMEMAKGKIDPNDQSVIVGFEMYRGKDRPDLVKWIRSQKYILFVEEL